MYKPRRYHRNVSKEQVLSDIRLVAERLRRKTLTLDEYLAHGTYGPSTAIRRCGSWSGAVVEAGLEKGPYRYNIPKDEVLADIQRTAEKLGRKTLTGDEYRSHGKFNPCTAASRCGSWPKALVEAGLDCQYHRNISNDELVADMQRVAGDLGRRVLIMWEYRAHGRFSPNTAIRRWGSWSRAVSEAGLLEGRRRRY